MDRIIIINYDFTDGTEISYGEAIKTTRSFTTNCLEFFSSDNINATVIRKDGSSINVGDLLENKNGHCLKEIRKSHDLRKMLLAGSFTWRFK